MPREEDTLIRLFRAVSKAELDDIIDSGGLRQKPGGLSYEGKLFATSIVHAVAFGRINYWLDASIGLDTPFHLLEIRVPRFLNTQFEFQYLRQNGCEVRRLNSV